MTDDARPPPDKPEIRRITGDAPGRWLAGPAGRTVLGVLGLAFLSAALALSLTAGK